MDICSKLRDYRVADNGDLTEVADIANFNPDKILVREIMYDKLYPLSDVARGPFSVSKENGYQVLTGTDMQGMMQKIRIVNKITEILNQDLKTWYAVSMGSIRLYLPIK